MGPALAEGVAAALGVAAEGVAAEVGALPLGAGEGEGEVFRGRGPVERGE